MKLCGDPRPGRREAACQAGRAAAHLGGGAARIGRAGGVREVGVMVSASTILLAILRSAERERIVGGKHGVWKNFPRRR